MHGSMKPIYMHIPGLFSVTVRKSPAITKENQIVANNSYNYRKDRGDYDIITIPANWEAEIQERSTALRKSVIRSYI